MDKFNEYLQHKSFVKSNALLRPGKESSSSRVRLIWHRRDLRLHDNELYSNLTDADGFNVPSVSLFVFDKKFFEPQRSLALYGEKDHANRVVWCGPHAAKALIEAVCSLRSRIRSKGGELLVRYGDPFIIIPTIVTRIGATEIVFGEEPGYYETSLSKKLIKFYACKDVKVINTCGYTLWHPNDLPQDPNEWYQLAHPKQKRKKKIYQHTSKNKDEADIVDVTPTRFRGMSKIMGEFRKAANSIAKVRDLFDEPERLVLPALFYGEYFCDYEGVVPSLEDLMQPLSSSLEIGTLFGLDENIIGFVLKAAIKKMNTDNNKEINESTGLKRLEKFIDEGYACVADRSKVDVSDNNSSRFSVHFSLGTLSPRAVYWKASKFGDSCKWLCNHLEMRDFFLFTTFANNHRIFCLEGLPVTRRQVATWISPHTHSTYWTRWACGRTHLPMVDSGIIELMCTGYCSNRVRQNIASVLTKDLYIDWRAGAEWFQFLLEDHCVGANFGNWLYFSGVGADPKNRHFRTISQLKRYDPLGEYIKKWLPALQTNCLESVFRPWDFEIKGFEDPIVDPQTQYTWRDLKILKDNGTLS